MGTNRKGHDPVQGRIANRPTVDKLTDAQLVTLYAQLNANIGVKPYTFHDVREEVKRRGFYQKYLTASLDGEL